MGGFCSLDKQCTWSNNSRICKHGICKCVKGFTVIDFACKKSNVKQISFKIVMFLSYQRMLMIVFETIIKK